MTRNGSSHASAASLNIAIVLLGVWILVFGGGFLYVQYLLAQEAEPETLENYTEVAQDRIAKHSDALQEEAMGLASEVTPVIAEAAYEQIKQDYPRYLDVLEDASDEYWVEVEDLLVKKTKTQYRDYLAAHRHVLEEEFPEHASDEKIDRVIDEFERTFNQLIDRYYVDEFREASKDTVALWRKFEPVDPPAPGEPSLPEQLADYTADWTFMISTKEEEGPPPAGRASARRANGRSAQAAPLPPKLPASSDENRRAPEAPTSVGDPSSDGGERPSVDLE